MAERLVVRFGQNMGCMFLHLSGRGGRPRPRVLCDGDGGILHA